jgi:hypothetical protein
LRWLIQINGPAACEVANVFAQQFLRIASWLFSLSPGEAVKRAFRAGDLHAIELQGRMRQRWRF